MRGVSGLYGITVAWWNACAAFFSFWKIMLTTGTKRRPAQGPVCSLFFCGENSLLDTNGIGIGMVIDINRPPLRRLKGRSRCLSSSCRWHAFVARSKQYCPMDAAAPSLCQYTSIDTEIQPCRTIYPEKPCMMRENPPAST